MKCLLVDDHGLIRDALAMLISQRSPDTSLRFAATLAEAQAALLREPDIDLVLLDLQLPDSRGTATVKAIRFCSPSARVVVLSAEDHAGIAQDCTLAGATCFIPKRADFLALDTTLAAILQTHTSPNHPASDALSDIAEPVAPKTNSLGLTQRQIDVLSLMIEGQANKVIARKLNLSESTVKTHVQAIFERLGVKTRTQAVVAAAKRGWSLPHDSQS
jgi:two-component system, NarL family, nitrate/nitrite response regulator NarL